MAVRLAVTHRDLPLTDLVATLRKAGATWFKNSDLLLLEELIRRAQKSAGANKEPPDGRHQICPICGGRIPDVRPAEPPAGGFGGRALTVDEIAQIEAWGRRENSIYAAFAGTDHVGEGRSTEGAGEA